MRWLLDLLYLMAGLLLSPIWLSRMIRTGKFRTDWQGRFGRTPALERSDRSRLLLHAVSVGEVNAIRLLVQRLAQIRPAIDIVIASTTDTGFARAMSLFGEHHAVVRYPYDFSIAVRRFLDAVRPDAVALVELELWPNFTAACHRREVPVCVINGRLTERSFARYRLVKFAMSRSFRHLAFAAVQSEAYAARFASMGVLTDESDQPAGRVIVTGTMKWDTAEIADAVAGSEQLAVDMGIDRSRPLIVAGSTAPEEHALFASAAPEGVQLLCAPRRPEWCDQAAAALPGCARRSIGQRGSTTGRFLLDTIGELRQAYALADVVIIGRSFGNLHGSDMMEPIALGKPTVVGPAVADFQQTMDALLAGNGVVQTDTTHLASVLEHLLNDPAAAAELAANGRAVIRENQGATDEHVRLLQRLLGVSE